MGGLTSSELALVITARNQASAALGAVSGQLSTLETRTAKTKAAMKTMAVVTAAAFVGVVAGIGAFVAAGVGAYAQFDSAMQQSVAIMGDINQETRDEMEMTAREVAKTTTFSAEQAAESYFFLASAGLDAQQSIAAMPQVAAFAQAGMFDMATATDLATDAQSALGLTVDDAGQNLENLTRVTDVFVRANTLANATVEQFSTAMTNKAGAALKAVGKDIEEGTAVLAAFADQGIKGAEAGTALNIVMRDMQTRALANEDAFAAHNIAVFDAQGEMRNMADIVGDLEGALDGMSDKQAKATLAQLGFTDKSISYIQTIIGTSDAIRDYEEQLRSSSGFTDQVAGKQLESISAQWSLFKSRITDVAIELGKQLAPTVKDILEQLAVWAEVYGPRVIEWVKDFGKWIGDAIGTGVDFVKAIVSVIEGFEDTEDAIEKLPGPLQAIVRGFQSIMQWWNNLSPGWKDFISSAVKFVPIILGLNLAFTLLVGTIGFLTSPIVLIVAGLAALAAGLKWAWENSETFQNVINGVVEWFTGTAVPFLQDAWEAIVEAVKAAWEFIQEAVDAGMEVVMTLWDSFGGTILETASDVWDAILMVIEGAWEFLQGLWNTFTALLTGDWEGFWAGIEQTVNGAIQFVQGIIKTGWEIINGYFSAFGDFLRDFWPGIWDWIKDTASEKWDDLKAWFEGVMDSFAEFWEGGWSGFVDKMGDILGGMANAAKAPINAVIGVIEGLVNAAISGLNGIIGAANKIPGVSIGTIGHFDIPRLAEGGTAVRSGLALVGEAGPEVITLPKGASVVPLTASRGPGGMGGRTITVPLVVDGKVLTEIVIEESGLGDISVSRRTA